MTSSSSDPPSYVKKLYFRVLQYLYSRKALSLPEISFLNILRELQFDVTEDGVTKDVLFEMCRDEAMKYTDPIRCYVKSLNNDDDDEYVFFIPEQLCHPNLFPFLFKMCSAPKQHMIRQSDLIYLSAREKVQLKVLNDLALVQMVYQTFQDASDCLVSAVTYRATNKVISLIKHGQLTAQNCKYWLETHMVEEEKRKEKQTAIEEKERQFIPYDEHFDDLKDGLLQTELEIASSPPSSMAMDKLTASLEQIGKIHEKEKDKITPITTPIQRNNRHFRRLPRHTTPIPQYTRDEVEAFKRHLSVKYKQQQQGPSPIDTE